MQRRPPHFSAPRTRAVFNVGLLAFLLIATASRIASAERIWAVTAEQQLIEFDSSNPAAILVGAPVGGVPPVVGVARRPADRGIYTVDAYGSLQIYDANTGNFAGIHNTTSPYLSGSRFAVSFDPATDRLRAISDAAQNLLVDPNSATVLSTGTAPAYASGDPNFGRHPNLGDIAYTAAIGGHDTLYGIDSGLDELVRIGSPGGSPLSASSGQLFTVGPLGVDTSDHVGFGISSSTGIANAVLDTPNPSGLDTSKLYTIDLNTGHATFVGEVGGGMDIISATIVPGSIPEPAGGLAMVLTAFACRRPRSA